MKNKELWQPTKIIKNERGRIIGTHMHKITGYLYERVIRQHASGILADVGCGDVPFYFMYKDLVKENICIDWQEFNDRPSFLDYTVDLNKDKIPLESQSVDTVLCTDVLEHISNPDSLFSEMARILRPKGKLILTVPFMYWIHAAPHDHHRYTKFKLQEFCTQNGLNVVSIEEWGGLPEILYDLVWKGYFYYNLPFRRYALFSWRVFGKFLYNRSFVKRYSERTKEAFPLGYILVAEKSL